MFTWTFNSVKKIRCFVNKEVETILTILIVNKINICLYNILQLCNCALLSIDYCNTKLEY